uniref:Uncharacterized protein n=1 Tax=viral metagenome TaxID=1070528 RepID=A0A6M3IFP8_9ZZZZ
MLKGRILSIKWAGTFEVALDGTVKYFTAWDDARAWLLSVLKYAKDDKKKALLQEDLKHVI